MGIYEAGAVVNLLRYELSGKFSDEAGEFLSLHRVREFWFYLSTFFLGFDRGRWKGKKLDGNSMNKNIMTRYGQDICLTCICMFNILGPHILPDTLYICKALSESSAASAYICKVATK